MIKLTLAGVVIVCAMLLCPIAKQPHGTVTMQQMQTEAAWIGPQDKSVACAWFREGTMPSG